MMIRFITNRSNRNAIALFQNPAVFALLELSIAVGNYALFKNLS